jgi:hypothetical protein
LYTGVLSQHGILTPLLKSVEDEDAATTKALIAAGAATQYPSHYAGRSVEPAVDETIRELFEHYTKVFMTLTANPAALVSAALAHCNSLAAPEIADHAMPLTLRAYHLEPPFLWAPPAARVAVQAWARDAFIVQLAAKTDPFPELPDDCAGDVLEYLELTMPREDMVYVVTHCSSPEAHSWVRTVIAAAIAVSL